MKLVSRHRGSSKFIPAFSVVKTTNPFSKARLRFLSPFASNWNTSNNFPGRYSTSLIIKIWIKMMKYFSPIRLTKNKTKIDRILCWSMKYFCGEIFYFTSESLTIPKEGKWDIVVKSQICVSFDQAIILLCNLSHRYIHPHMKNEAWTKLFSAALFKSSNKKNQRKCSSLENWFHSHCGEL